MDTLWELSAHWLSVWFMATDRPLHFFVNYIGNGLLRKWLSRLIGHDSLQESESR